MTFINVFKNNFFFFYQINLPVAICLIKIKQSACQRVKPDLIQQSSNVSSVVFWYSQRRKTSEIIPSYHFSTHVHEIYCLGGDEHQSSERSA